MARAPNYPAADVCVVVLASGDSKLSTAYIKWPRNFGVVGRVAHCSPEKTAVRRVIRALRRIYIITARLSFTSMHAKAYRTLPYWLQPGSPDPVASVAPRLADVQFENRAEVVWCASQPTWNSVYEWAGVYNSRLCCYKSSLVAQPLISGCLTSVAFI